MERETGVGERGIGIGERERENERKRDMSGRKGREREEMGEREN